MILCDKEINFSMQGETMNYFINCMSTPRSPRKVLQDNSLEGQHVMLV